MYIFLIMNFLLFSMKLLTDSKNPSSNPFKMLWSGNFDPENAYRNPLVVMKYHTGSCVKGICISADFSYIQWGMDTVENETNSKEREADTEIMVLLPEQSLEFVRVS